VNTTVAPERAVSDVSPVDFAWGDPEPVEGSKGSTATVAFKMEQNAAVVKLESWIADV
jgi:hypothetical protein